MSRFAHIQDHKVIRILDTVGGEPHVDSGEVIAIGGREVEIGLPEADLRAMLLAPMKTKHASPSPQKDPAPKPAPEKAKVEEPKELSLLAARNNEMRPQQAEAAKNMTNPLLHGQAKPEDNRTTPKHK